MSKIKKIEAHEILDTRGNPTIETLVTLSDDQHAKSSVPSGTVGGTYEAVDLRDGDAARYEGMGVLKAADAVNKIIAPRLIGMEVFKQQEIDQAMIELDGTQNKSNLGANSILSVSQAVVKVAAKSSLLPLPLYIRQFVSGNISKKIPTPMFNLLEGGKHGGRSLNFQEFLLIPASSKSYQESLEMGVKIYHTLRKDLYDKGDIVLVADEGGFSPNVATNQAGIALLKESIETAGYSFSLDAFIGIDVGANSFRDGKTYKIKDRAIPYNPEDLINFYQELITDYSLIYLEDPFAEDDWDSWKKMYAATNTKTLLVGDDLTATNPYRLQLALDNNVTGGIVIKPSQIGTITESIVVSEIARYKGLKIIVSNRSSETMDGFIADFAVGIGADYVKFGAPARERVAKYNKLIEVEKQLTNL